MRGRQFTHRRVSFVDLILIACSTSGRKDTLLDELSKHVAMQDLVAAFELIARIVKKKESLGPPIGIEQVLYSALKSGTHCKLRIIGVTLTAELPLCSLEFIRSSKQV